MGTCRYCGKSAGWFSSHHKDCQKAHDSGMADLSVLIDDFFAQRITSASMRQRIQGLRSGYYLTDDDIAGEAPSHIARFSAAIQRPISPRPMHLMEDFLRWFETDPRAVEYRHLTWEKELEEAREAGADGGTQVRL